MEQGGNDMFYSFSVGIKFFWEHPLVKMFFFECECDDFAAELPIRSFKTRLAGVMLAPAVHIFLAFLRGAEHGAVIHERIIPFAGIFAINGFCNKGQDCGIGYGAMPRKEKVDVYPPDIGFNKRRWRVKSKRGNGSSSRFANAREPGKLLRITRHGRAVPRHDLLCRAFQIQRAAIVTESLPHSEDAGKPGSGQLEKIWKTGKEFMILGNNPFHLRLLEHDFRNKNVIRITCAPPRQITARVAVVSEDYTSERPHLHWRDRHTVSINDGYFIRQLSEESSQKFYL